MFQALAHAPASLRRLPVELFFAESFYQMADLFDYPLVEDNNPGFLRLTVNPERLVGRYFTVPAPGRENDPPQRVDKFIIDLRTHRVR